jgi:transglutaminase-like putative cysteine protease
MIRKADLLTGHAPEMLWLITGITLAVLPHMLHMPIWATLIFSLLLGCRLLISSGSRRAVFIKSLPFKLTVGVIISAGVFANFGTMVGRDAGVTLLVLLAGMKLLEINTDRDYYISAYIGFLLVLTNFFYNQTLPVSLYLAVTLVILIGALLGFNDRERPTRPRERLQQAATLFAHAMPLMLIMFLLFPRFSGPLWGLPKDALSGLSGIDDEMSPGSISQLILSDEVAFRVEFSGPLPEKSDLYWRGPVLWYTDGFKWVPDRPQRSTPRVVTGSEGLRYTITLEATDKNWLYALELPTTPAENSYLSHDLQLRTRRPVITRTRYEVTSYPCALLSSTGTEELQNALQLPAEYHPRAIALAQSWKAEGAGPRQIAERALRYFNEQQFYYTLTPPVLPNDTVDDFLFETRQGFCEHYASAFTVLMRAAGIPARVVTGYQGGTLNPVGNYLVIYQRDAHAWTEVWLGEEEGWVRFDPTSAVSPARVTMGIQGAIPQGLIDVPLGLYNNSLARSLWERVNNTFDAINNRWNQWVLGYDRNRQRMLLGQIGLGGLNREELMTGMIIVVTLCLALIGYGLFRRTTAPTDRARYWYDRFRSRLARAGIRIEVSEGPLDLARRASVLRSDLAEAIQRITERYIAVRYANHPEGVEQLAAEVKLFRPKRGPDL